MPHSQPKPHRARWTIFSVLALMYVLAYFYRVSMAVVAKDLAADLALSPAQLGTLSGIFFYVYAFSMIPLGPLLDRFGGRRVISLFGLLSTTGGILFALAPDYHSSMAGRVLIGIGTGCVLMGSLKIFTEWFTLAEFATISGFMVAVGNLGNLCATAPLAHAVSRFGWRRSFLVVGVIQGIATLLVLLVARDRPPHPDGEGEERTEHHGEKGFLAAWRCIGATPSFWSLSLLAFFWYGNYMVLQGLWGGPYLMEGAGLTRQGAGNILLCTSLGFITGCLLLGRITDHILRSRKKTLLVGQSLLFILMLLMLGPAEVLPRPVLALVFYLIGFAVSSGVAVYPMTREMFPHTIVATAMTSVNFFILMGAATVQQAMGGVIGRFPKGAAGYPSQAYHVAFLIPICGLLIALILFPLCRDTNPTH